MRSEDLEKFSQIMTGLSELYGKDVSGFMLDIYFQALSSFSIEAIDSAVSAHVRNPDTGQFFPKPADIVRLISGTSRDAGQIAWTKVDKAVRGVGPWETVCFDDQIIHKVISDMGGWIQLGDKDESEWPFVAKDFQERYRAYKSRGAAIENYPQKLIGEHEASNNKKGFQSDPPVLIGDAQEAKRVMLGGSRNSSLRIEKLSVGDLLPAGKREAV